MKESRLFYWMILGFVILCWILASQQRMVRDAMHESDVAWLEYDHTVIWRSIAAENYMAGLKKGFSLGHYIGRHPGTMFAVPIPEIPKVQSAKPPAINKKGAADDLDENRSVHFGGPVRIL